MAKAKSAPADGGSGGIADSGIFGLIGTTVQCESDDQSTYCKIARIVNIVVWILLLFAIFYVAKNFLLGSRR